MNIALRILRRLGERRPYFHIHGDDDSLYMGRWWVLGGSHPIRDDRPDFLLGWNRGRLDAWIGKFVAVRLHHIVREDRCRDHHTHPASFISIVLGGWYRERRPYRQQQHAILDPIEFTDTLRRPGSIAFRRASDRHTITEVSPGGAWTVVIWLRKRGSWGFVTPDNRLVPWREYEVKP